MAWTTVLSPAKINPFLEVVSGRSDGFHDLDTFMVRVDLCDRISFRLRNDGEISLRERAPAAPDRPGLPLDNRNLIWKAIEALGARAGRRLGIDVVLEKRIPVAAGFGGGSGNAVTTLITLNRLGGLGLGWRALRDIADTLGSDLAFFFAPAAARCMGRGEIIDELADYRRFQVVLAAPPDGLDTGTVFGHCRVPAEPRDGSWFARHWATARLAELGARMHNRLQEAARELSPSIDRLRWQFARLGCRAHQMSGSGSGWFGLFETRVEARRAKRVLEARLPGWQVFAVGTASRRTAGMAC